MTLTIGICRISPDCCIRTIVTFFFGAASVSYHDNPCKQTLLVIPPQSARPREAGWLGEGAPEILRCAQDDSLELCHPERSEGSLRPAPYTLRCAQRDTPDLQMSRETHSWLC